MRYPGFTLAELLIAMAILGVIATFAIPKVLNAQQSSKWNASGKEAAATISGAFTAYKLNGSLNAGTLATDLTPYINYASVQTALIDHVTGYGSFDCTLAGYACLKMHNGGTLQASNDYFGSANATNSIQFLFDPDGAYSGGTTGPGKSVMFVLYYNGRLTTADLVEGDTLYTKGVALDISTFDTPADWFSWD